MSSTPAYHLKGILDALEKHHQRATYGAVAALTGKTPRSLMQGLPKNWRHSFVVNQETGEPSEYSEPRKHHLLRDRPTILDSADALAEWLVDPK